MSAVQARGQRIAVVLLVGIFTLALASGAQAEHNRLELLSIGPAGGNGPFTACGVETFTCLAGMSADGSHVFFNTAEGLVSSDTDGQLDVYDRSGGATTLVSTSSYGATSQFAQFVGASADGARVFFRTASAVAPEDQDLRQDIYERSGGTTKLVSTGPDGGNGPFDVCQAGYPTNPPCFSTKFSRDGTHVFFVTQERLVSADADDHHDVYERTGSITRLVSTGSSTGTPSYPADWVAGVSDDGAHVFFRTAQSLVPGDTDGALYDIYERFGDTTTLVSTGPRSATPVHQQGNFASSSDGTQVFFETKEALTFDDTDNFADIYRRSNGVTTLVSGRVSGSGIGSEDVNYGWTASRDGSTVVFETHESLLSEDSDGDACVEYDEFGDPYPRPCRDVYEYTDGALRLVSTGLTGGNGGFDAIFNGNFYARHLSENGDRIFFMTGEPLVSVDGDTSADVYERSGGTTTLISTGPKGASGPFEAGFWGASSDGSRLFFRTAEQLVGGDTDSGEDYYERFGNRTTLVLNYVGNLVGVSEDGTHAVFVSAGRQLPEDTDSQWDLYAAVIGPPVAAGYPRPKNANYSRVALAPAYEQCTAADSVHAAPLASPSCSPPVQASDFLTIGTSDANGAGANSTGFVEFRVTGESPIDLGNGDQADVRITAQLRDVRRKSDLLDYEGELQAVATLRLTDGDYKGAPITDPPATATDLPFSFVMPCTATTDVSIGSTCAVSTTVDAVVPGIATEGLRSVWQLDGIEVFDGGSDGDGDTAGDNTLFARQGLFTP